MTGGNKTTFLEMAGEFPVRTGVFTLVPLLFTMLQLVNYAHGGSLLLTGGFSLAVLVYTVLVHQYHLAAFQRAKLSPGQSR
jgi:hypothetical protein